MSPPVACSLSSTDHGARLTGWRQLLGAGTLRQLPDGVGATLPISEVVRATELAVAEQECCPFFSFGVTLRGASFDLTIRTTREGAAMLTDLLPASEGTSA